VSVFFGLGDIYTYTYAGFIFRRGEERDIEKGRNTIT
jgi:hypothetical protein